MDGVSRGQEVCVSWIVPIALGQETEGDTQRARRLQQDFTMSKSPACARHHSGGDPRLKIGLPIPDGPTGLDVDRTSAGYPQPLKGSL